MPCCSATVSRISYRLPGSAWETIVYRRRGEMCFSLIETPGYSRYEYGHNQVFGLAPPGLGYDYNYGWIVCSVEYQFTSEPLLSGLYAIRCVDPLIGEVAPIYASQSAPPPMGTGGWKLTTTLDGIQDREILLTSKPDIKFECGDDCPPGYCKIPCSRSPRGFCCCRDRTVRGQ